MRLPVLAPPLLLAQKVLRRLPFRPADIGKLCFLRFEGVPQVRSSLLRGPATVRFATPEDLAALATLQNKADVFRARFDEGDRCVVAILDGRIVGYEWFSDQAVHHESSWGYPISIPGGFVYAYDAYIDPACRNTGVWLRFKAHLAEWMAACGKRGVLTFVDYGNWPSLRTHLRFGFQPTESVIALRVLGLRLFRKVCAVGAAVSSGLAWLSMHPAAMHAHHATRVLHTALVFVRR